MCGGVGSRFWPFSRDDKPKQFIDFFGTGESLLQTTVRRISRLIPKENIILVSNSAYRELLREQLPDIPEGNILLEPARRNTAPCICWAARHIISLDPDASMIVLPSDHLILKELEFADAITEGFEFVEKEEALLTIGITPTSPHTGYGYIQRGDAAGDWPGIMKVRLFTEKPPLEMAREFLKSGEFLWNAGIFLWKAEAILKAFRQHAPEIAASFDERADAFGTPREPEAVVRIFSEVDSISVDYAVMERSDDVYVKEADLGWSDLGSWKALHDISPKDRHGNVTQNCMVLADDCEGTVFASTDRERVIVASGLRDYIVADNGNALLIYPLAEEQKIRQTVIDLRTKFGDKYL